MTGGAHQAGNETGSPWRLHLLMLSVALAWGGAFPAIKIALASLTPAQVALGRFLVAAAPFVVVLALRGVPRFDRRELLMLPVLGFLSVSVYHLALNWGEVNTPAGTASLIVATGPVWGTLLSFGLGREEPSWRKAAGIAVALTGTVVLILHGHGRAELGLPYLEGALAILGASLAWALYTVLSKPYLARHRSLPFNASVTLLGTAITLPALPGLWGNALAGGWPVLGALLFLGLAASFYGNTGYIVALSQLTPSETMVYIYLVPVVSLLASYLVLGEVLTIWALLGGALVVAGIAITNRARRASSPASAS